MFCRRLLLQYCRSRARVDYKATSRHHRLVQCQLVFITNRSLATTATSDTVLSSIGGAIATDISPLSPVTESIPNVAIEAPGTLLASTDLLSTPVLDPLLAPVSEISSVVEVVKVAVDVLPSLVWYNPIIYVTHAMDLVQTASGLPWWATLVCLGVTFRLSMVPCNIWLMRSQQKYFPVSSEFDKNRDANLHAADSRDFTKMAILRKEKKYLIAKHGISPFAMFKPVVVICACASIMFLSITNLTNMPYAPLLTTDFLWLTNLTVADPYRVFAAFNGVLVVTMLKSGVDTGKNPMIDLLCGTPLKIVGFITVMGVIQSNFSTALLIYWTSSNLAGLFTVVLLRSDSFRKLFGVVPLSEMKELQKTQPSLEDIIEQMKGSKTKTRKDGQKAEMKRHEKKAKELAKEDFFKDYK